jgi:hypothetical protein
MLMKLKRFKIRDFMKTLDSISTDHSTSNQDFQCKESSNATELLMLDSIDMVERPERINNSSSMESARLSDPTTGRTTPWRFNQMVDTPTSDSPLQSVQDGGNSSDMNLHSL